ncbi:hypothetical protein [Chitinophaga nivalis]|uniref:Uncharacterized protein n=1 Tax=Chitinophaga nivalis TaxID=2991709 RepID=A0ABT3IRQ5_9BACT|nr:hypothetical protein [Chitinophaga nivalis]MCW3463661.1 hypothetical protein [Chitinophaga nivalis]MCW3486649.1 hypothetical protein [Chitinophaga nivalis]
MRYCLLQLFVYLLLAFTGFSQQVVLSPAAVTDTGYYYVHKGCKALAPVPVALYGRKEVVAKIQPHKRFVPAPVREPWITVHGNVMYDLYYQSRVDTPYAEKDIHQHTVQTTLDITIKNQYPFHIAFSTQMGNSSLFRNITGANMQFFSKDIKNMLLARARGWEAGKLKQLQELDKLRGKLDSLMDRLSGLRGWLSSPVQIQRLIEEEERRLYGRKDTLLNALKDAVTRPAQQYANLDVEGIIKKHRLYDSLQQRLATKQVPVVKELPFATLYERRKKEADSLAREAQKMESKYWALQDKYGQRKTNLLEVLSHSRNNKELTDRLGDMGLPDSILPKGYRTLLAVRSFGIGRTLVNYSELTAKDISITGVQVEYNPSYYVAFATGAVDYRFRNFILNENRPKQYLNLVRVGAGMKEGNNVILTYYTGRKQVYNVNTSAVPEAAANNDNNIMGVSLEGQWRLGRHTYFIAEAAKSSLPYYARKASGEKVLSSVFNFGSRSNEAYSVKLNTMVTRTATRISGMFKLMGRDFQSFSLYTTGSDQTAWHIRVDQPFFRKQLLLTGAVRKNDYVTHLEPASFRSNTIFKSIQATMRIRRWPVLTVGYQPTAQLMKLSEDRYMESLFYTLTGTASHFYKYRQTTMNTVLSYSQFYNRKTDSNFVYFNSRNLIANHTVFLSRFTLNGMLSAAVNEEYALYGVSGDVTCRLKKWLEVGGGLKYNQQTVYNIRQLGYVANARVQVPYFGEVALMADKGFVPGAEKKLVPNNTGRLTYTRIF